MTKRYEVKYKHVGGVSNSVQAMTVTASNMSEAKNKVKSAKSSHHISIISCVEK